MLTLKTYRAISGVKKHWLALNARQAEHTSAYQSFFINEKLFNRLFVYAIRKKYLPLICVIFDDGIPVIIAPLCKYIGKDTYCTMGDVNGFQVYDFIYDISMTPEKMRECIDYLLTQLRISTLILNNVPANSLLLSDTHIDSVQYKKSISCNENVNIFFGDNYENWFCRLSKHARQNLRTAYNRMNTDSVSVRCETKCGEPVDRKTIKKLLDIYCSRHKERYGLKTSAIKRAYLEHLDFSTDYQQNYPDNFNAILYLNDKIAAFMSGIVEKGRSSAVIPRLSIVAEFARYSPGMVLINEVAKRFTSDLQIPNLDLSKGVENYKLSSGGEIYHTYNITFTQDMDFK